MLNKVELGRQLASLWHRVQEEQPLIQSITHPITMNDSANAILAVGARPNMASHPAEVAEVVRGAKALAINLGNISDIRMEAMTRAGKAAKELDIPRLIDAVGVGCSTLRRDFAAQWIRDCQPQIIKGNSSEILSLCGATTHASGVDAGVADTVTDENMADMAPVFAAYARKQGAVLLVSGPVDVITDGTVTIGVANGTPKLAKLTGTGCMQGTLAAVYLSVGSPWQAAVTGAVVMGLAGEDSALRSPGMGTFHVDLLDALSLLRGEDIQRNIRILDTYGAWL